MCQQMGGGPTAWMDGWLVGWMDEAATEENRREGKEDGLMFNGATRMKAYEAHGAHRHISIHPVQQKNRNES